MINYYHNITLFRFLDSSVTCTCEWNHVFDNREENRTIWLVDVDYCSLLSIRRVLLGIFERDSYL